MFIDVYGTNICSSVVPHPATVMIPQSLYYLTTWPQFLTLSLGEDGEQIAAVLPGREEVSVAVLKSCDDSGETGHSSLSEADSLEDSRASKAEERRPTEGCMEKGLPLRKKYKNAR